MAAGRVATGFSLPYVARYSANGGVVTYSGARQLARGVNVNLQPESSDDNNFYADNVAAETVAGTFTGGTATLTVDGLKEDAEKLLLGLPAADTSGFVHYGDSAQIPYVGVGFICRYMSAGSTEYVPVVLTKCRANMPSLEANTQEAEIEWQTQEITFNMLRDDSTNHDWKMVGTALTTEAMAEAKIKTALGIS